MKKMMKVFSFVLTLVMICSLVFVLADTNAVHAADTDYTITYDANGGMFADGSTTNQVTYTGGTVTKYAHTPNIDDDGNVDGNFSVNMHDKQVVTIPGASRLHVSIRWSVGSGDSVIYVIPGTYDGEIDGLNMQCGQIDTLYSRNYSSRINTSEYAISGDTVTFGFYSGSYGAGYGYYAVITDVSDLNHEYEVPQNNEGFVFDGWYDAPSGGNHVDEKLLDSDTTVYAHYLKASQPQITFDANGGTFSNGTSQNVVNYSSYEADETVTETRIVHSYNLNDDGTKREDYDSWYHENKIVTIPGAKQLQVTITYGTAQSKYNYDSIFIIPRVFTDSVSSYYQNSGYGEIARLYGSKSTRTFSIPGNTVTFAVDCSANYNLYNPEKYGYYAVVSAEVDKSDATVTSGSYEIPVAANDGYSFNGWYTSPSGGQLVDINHVSEDTTVYAHYSNKLYAILYNDGELVLQRGSYADPNRSVLLNAEVSETSTSTSVPWSSNKNRIVTVTFKDVVHPRTTSGWFQNCQFLESVNNGNNLDLSRASSIASMFSGCNRLKNIDVSTWNLSNVENMSYVFNNCGVLEQLDVANWNTGKVTTMSHLFYNCKKLQCLDVSGWNTSKVRDMSYLLYEDTFSYDTEIIWEEFDVSHWDTSSVENMDSMFCIRKNGPKRIIRTLDVSNWNTSSVTNMDSLFAGMNGVSELDVSHWNTSNVTIMRAMFSNCSSALSGLDVSNFDTSKVTNMATMFQGWSLPTIDVSNFDTSKVTNMSNMFGWASGLRSLDLSGWNTFSLENVSSMFQYCSNLEELDLSGWDTSHITSATKWMNGCSSLQAVTITDFDFSVNTDLKLPTPPVGTAQKWVLRGDDDGSSALTPEEMQAAGTVTPGTWVWLYYGDRAMIMLNANGGSVSPNLITVFADELQNGFTLPAATRLHYDFLGWTLDADGSGTKYTSDMDVSSVLELGNHVTFYAQWAPSLVREYSVYHYTQRVDLDGYDVADFELLHGDIGETVSPPVKNYDGYVMPEVQSGIVLDDDSLVFNYYYNRVTYEVVYDGNGATYGDVMPNQRMVGGVSSNLADNTYYKSGAIFVGWNTEPDGSGVSYTANALVTNLTDEPNGVVTLYAQWIENGNEVLEPSAGKVTVTGKAGKTVVIPDLPAGTTYEIHEILNSDVWILDNIVNGSGLIGANDILRSSVSNKYNAFTSVPIVVYKQVLDSITNEKTDFDEGIFSFTLYRRDRGNYIPIETVYNSALDMSEYVLNDDGEQIVNPHYGMAPVVFGSLEFTQEDIGKTIELVVIENRADGYYAQNNVYIDVTVEDAGHGHLNAVAKYRNDIDTISNIKYNSGSNYGMLMFEKSVVGAYPEDSEFSFNVRLYDDSNNDYDGQVMYVVGSGDILGDAQMIRQDVWQNGTPITIGANQWVLLQGAPVGMNYDITEVEQDGWLLLQSSKTTGECVAVNSEQEIMDFVSNPARFVNGFSAEGSLNLEATKEMVGRGLNYGEFTFVVEDEDGNIISRGENDADGKIAFEPIPYTNDDVGNTYAYTVREVIPDYQAGGVTYSDTVYDITVDVVLEKGVLKAVPSENAQNMVFTNTYTAADTSITLDGSKTLVGRELKDSDTWTFTISGDGPLPAETSVDVTPLNDDTFSFTIPFTQADLDGESEKTFTYTISESGFVPFVKNDSAKTVTIRLSDDGEGNLRAEVLRASSDDLTFVNHANVLLPATGSMTAILVSIAGVALMTAGFVFYRKKRGTNAA